MYVDYSIGEDELATTAGNTAYAVLLANKFNDTVFHFKNGIFLCSVGSEL